MVGHHLFGAEQLHETALKRGLGLPWRVAELAASLAELLAKPVGRIAHIGGVQLAAPQYLADHLLGSDDLASGRRELLLLALRAPAVHWFLPILHLSVARPQVLTCRVITQREHLLMYSTLVWRVCQIISW